MKATNDYNVAMAKDHLVLLTLMTAHSTWVCGGFPTDEMIVICIFVTLMLPYGFDMSERTQVVSD